MTRFWLERALVDGAVLDGVLVTERDGTIDSVELAAPPSTGDVSLTGLALPGFANAHSHAFHRVLRGRTHGDGGSFWTWRDRMYAIADRLTPENYHALATAVFAELVLAGYTVVGEFHYLHRAPGGVRYADPNAMTEAVTDAAALAGIRLTLLDTLYLRGGLDAEGRELPLDDHQARFSDGSVEAWADRHARLTQSPTLRIGAAVHSMRAVPRESLPALRAATIGTPLHAHVSEQPAENSAAHAAWGLSPLAVLADAGLVTSDFTAVHGTHLSAHDIDALGRADAAACLCPTTERDLGDGIGPVGALLAAGVPMAIGSDQHAIADPFDELRALEGHERLATRSRGRIAPQELGRIGTENGYRSLGWAGGRIARGLPCDLVVIDDRSVRTAGADPAQIVFAATAQDVTDTVIAGERVVTAGRHRLGDVGDLLLRAIGEVSG